MGAEIVNAEINLDGTLLTYATKVTAKKNKDTNTTLTFEGDVNTMAKNTGGTITIEGLYWPEDVDSAVGLEQKLESNLIKTVTCTGTSYTANGDPYYKTIIGNNVIITSDEDEWSPSDGITYKLELAVNSLTRTVKRK